MKRILTLALVLALGLVLSGCLREKHIYIPPVRKTEQTTETTLPDTQPSEPEWVPGILRADMGVFGATYQRGDLVTVVGKLGDHYVIEGADANQLVPARLLRLSVEVVPEVRTGYAQYGTLVYPTGYFLGEPVRLQKNTKVQVLDAREDWMYIQWEEGIGFVSETMISKWPVSDTLGVAGEGNLTFLTSQEPAKRILLGSYVGDAYEEIPPCEGMILSDNTVGYLALLKRGDQVKVTETTETEYKIYLKGLTGSLPHWVLRMPEDGDYTPWEAFSQYGTRAYEEYQCINTYYFFRRNDRVTVVDLLEEINLYVIQMEDGRICYTPRDGLRKYQITGE